MTAHTEVDSAAWARATQTYHIEAEAIETALASIEQADFMKAAKLFAHAPVIAASACGHSGIACQHFAHLMCCINRPARFISPSEAIHGATGFLCEGSIMLLASRGGKTSELMPILKICREKGATIVAVTENADSPLAQGADIVLKMKVTRETDKYDSQGTTSFAVMNALFDALQAAIIELTGFQNESFAVVHPGGAVGERLNGGAL